MTPAFVAHTTHLRPPRRQPLKSSLARHVYIKPTIIPSRRARHARPVPTCTAAAIAPAWGVWTVLLGAAAGGLVANRTRVGAALSPPIVTTLATLALANLGLLPAAHPAYVLATKVLVPLAVPLLLFAADLRRVARDTGRLLPAFVLGALATALSIVIAFRVVPLVPALGADEAWKIAAALCARHIGGAVNFVSTADALGVSSAGVTAALAADNVVLSAYFVLLFGLARGVRDPAEDRALNAPPRPAPGQDASWADGVLDEDEEKEEFAGAADATDESDARANVSMEEVGVALTISAFMCYLGKAASAYIPFPLGVIPTITLIAVFFSTGFPQVFGRFSRAGNAVGIFFMQIFFAATGASGSLMGVIKSAPLLLVFILLHLAIHLGILFGVGRFALKLHPAEILVASNANVGGPATALAMTAAKDWKSMMIPALLIGVLGYSIATFVGLGVGHMFLKAG